MRQDLWRLLLIGGALMISTGCASRQEWVTWREHPTHFSSGDHLSFSIRHPEGAAAQVTRRDVALARNEGWWGKPVTVSQEQVLER